MTDQSEEHVRTRTWEANPDRARPLSVNPHLARAATRPTIDGLPEDASAELIPPVAMPHNTEMVQPTPATNLGEGWEAIALPSAGEAGYPAIIHIRRFGFPDQARLKAAAHHKSQLLLCKAIGATIDIDPAMLTTPDFDHILYWQRQHSYPANLPHAVEWRSRYNKPNKTDINKTKLTITVLERSPRLGELRAMGFDFPRMGALIWREAHEDELTVEQVEVLDWAMNFSGGADTFDIEARIAVINALPDLSILGYFDEWARVSKHGVAETVSIKCKHFDPETAMEDLASTLERIHIETNITAYTAADSQYVHSIFDEMAALKIAAETDKLKEVVAVADEVSIPLDVHMFFPAAE